MLPECETGLWDFLLGLDERAQQLLFAHCAGLSVNAVHVPAVRGSNKRRHAGQLPASTKPPMPASCNATSTRISRRSGRLRRLPAPKA